MNPFLLLPLVALTQNCHMVQSFQCSCKFTLLWLTRFHKYHNISINSLCPLLITYLSHFETSSKYHLILQYSAFGNPSDYILSLKQKYKDSQSYCLPTWNSNLNQPEDWEPTIKFNNKHKCLLVASSTSSKTLFDYTAEDGCHNSCWNVQCLT